MKKILALALAMILCLGMLAACHQGTGDNGGNGSVGNFEIPEGGYDGSEVTITFYSTMGADKAAILDKYIAKFNEMYPNIHIEHDNSRGGYDDVRDAVAVEITTGNHPNITYCYPDHVALYNLAGVVVTLDDLIASDIEVTKADGSKEILGLTDAQVADFIEGYYDEGKQFGDGLMYTLPFSKSTEVLYYNKTFFDANGLTVPTTWDEMEEVCKKIKEIDPNCIPLGYDSESNWFITMCEQYGSPYTSATGDHFLFDNEQNRNFVKEFREWYKAGYLTTQKIYGAYTSGLFVNIPSESNPVRSYMSIGSSAGATYQRPTKAPTGEVDANGNEISAYPFEVGIATIPQVDASKPKVISQGPSLCILNSENPQETVASWLFVKYLTTDVSFQAEFAMSSGYVPVLKSVAENEVYKNFLAQADGGDFIAALSAKVCMDQAHAYYTSPAFVGSSTARDQVGLLLQSCLVDTGSDVDAILDKAFKNAIVECNESI